MSNRRKSLWGKHKHRGKSRLDKGLDARRGPLHDDRGPSFDSVGILNVTVPDPDEVTIIKEVPAMHTGMNGEHKGERVEVGTAFLHSDSTVAIRYHDDAPLWAMEEIHAFADKIGYSLSTGEFTDGSA